MEHLPFTIDSIEVFLLIFVRVSIIIALLPVFGSTSVAPQIKMGLSLVLTTVLITSMPLTPAQALPPGTPILFLVLLIVKEAAVGFTIGFTASFLFAAVQFASRLIDTEMGFGMVDLIDPMSEAPVSVVGQLWVVVFTVFLLLINGHFFFILAIQKSFAVIPISGEHFKSGLIAAQFTNMTGELFVLGIKMSAPMYVALILTEMALGIVARTVPQLNIFFVGIPMKIVVGLGSTIIAFPTVAGLFKKIFEGLITDIWSVIYMMV
jgi:flagellar biosynthetic protein FliR